MKFIPKIINYRIIWLNSVFLHISLPTIDTIILTIIQLRDPYVISKYSTKLWNGEWIKQLERFTPMYHSTARCNRSSAEFIPHSASRKSQLTWACMFSSRRTSTPTWVLLVCTTPAPTKLSGLGSTLSSRLKPNPVNCKEDNFRSALGKEIKLQDIQFFV